LPCHQPFDVFLVAKDDNGIDADAQDQVGKGISPQQDQEGHGYGSSDRAHGDHPAHAECTGKDKDIHQHGQRRQRKVNSQGRGHPFAAFESYIDGETVAEKGSQTCTGNPPLSRFQKECYADRDHALEHIADQGDNTECLAGRAHDIGGADVAAAALPGVDAGQRFSEDQACGNGT